MSELILPLDRFGSSTHIQALENLVKRYEREEEPIHYRRAALQMNEATASSCLNYFNKLGLINQPGQQGVYEPPIATIEMINNGGDAKEDIFDIVEDDVVFEEAQFIQEQGVEDINELAESVASQLDTRYDDEEFDAEEDQKRVRRALGIFEELCLLSRDDETPSETPEEDTEERGSGEATESIETSPKARQFEEVPPKRADPNRLLEICMVLKQGGNWTIDEIGDEVDVTSDKAINHTISYGRKLGFINSIEDGEGIEASSRGFELGYEEELNENTEELFQDGIVEYDEYVVLLSVVFDDIEPDDSGLVEKDEVVKLIRTDLEITEPSDDSLGRAVTTLFDTLEAAGFGEVKAAGGGYSKRLSYEDGSVLFEDIFASIDDSKEPSEESNASPSSDSEELSTTEETSSQDDIESGSESSEETVADETSGRKDEVIRDSDQRIIKPEPVEHSRSISIEMEVTLDLAEIDSEDLDQKLSQLDSFLDDASELEEES